MPAMLAPDIDPVAISHGPLKIHRYGIRLGNNRVRVNCFMPDTDQPDSIPP